MMVNTMTATNQQPAKDVPGVIEVTEGLRYWARTSSGDPTAIAASRAITHHNWHAADSMPAPRHYDSSAARSALEAVRAGVLPREAFNDEADGDVPRTTTGMQAAVTLKLLHDAGAPLELMSVLTDAYGVDIHDVSLVWVRPGSDEHEVVEQNRIEGTGSDGFQRGGRPYVEPSLEDEDEESSAEPAFVPWNSDAIDRGTKAHKKLENELAQLVRERGLLPLSPHGGDEPFDVAWVADGVLHICEVKSLTQANQESQLRLGLGQLLGYLYRTKAEHWPGIDRKRGVLAVEGAPKHLDWVDVCAEHGVTLTWPEHFSELFGA
ncbi:hypothetical protein [Knoellia remsis]|nr:hypothetical protein [Knoellia remsis]